jgi:hypothetical protein
MSPHAPSSGPDDLSPGRPGAAPAHGRLLAREFFASALYVAIVLLAALVALPKGRLPSDTSVVQSMVGTALGLVLAHYIAFRLAAHLTAEGGSAPAEVVREAVAGLTGGLLVAVLAAIPYAIWDTDDALVATLIALAVLPAFMGLATARLRGANWLRSIVAAALALVVALLVVFVKYELGH